MQISHQLQESADEESSPKARHSSIDGEQKVTNDQFNANNIAEINEEDEDDEDESALNKPKTKMHPFLSIGKNVFNPILFLGNRLKELAKEEKK